MGKHLPWSLQMHPGVADELKQLGAVHIWRSSADMSEGDSGNSAPLIQTAFSVFDMRRVRHDASLHDAIVQLQLPAWASLQV